MVMVMRRDGAWGMMIMVIVGINDDDGDDEERLSVLKMRLVMMLRKVSGGCDDE